MQPFQRALSGAVLAVALGALFAGCSSTKLDETAPVESRTVPADGSTAGGAGAGGTAQSNVATVDLSKQGADAATGLLAQRTVFFDFDSFVVKSEFAGAIDGHAKRLNAAKAKKVVIEGHTDERGGREYNLALGQKRAEAVQKSLTLLGVSGEQIEAVSFGEERAAAQGSGEAVWAQNRRAEIKDR